MTADAALLHRYAQSQDASAFAELVQRYAGMVYGTCLRITGNPHDAEDAAQDCFLDLARHTDAVSASLPGWLHKAAVSHSRMAVRSAARRRQREEKAMAKAAGEAEEAWEETASRVDQALEELPDHLRVALIRHYLQGQKQTEIATVLGVNQSTVSRLINRGVKELRKNLKRAGVSVSVGALTFLLAQKTACAAPATLIGALGKMALAGVGTAGGAAAGTAAIGAAAGGAGAAPAIAASTGAGVGLLASLLGTVQAKIAIVAVATAAAVTGTVAYRHAVTPGSPDEKKDAQRASVTGRPEADSAPEAPFLRIYEVGKTPEEFPEREDLSTPESAYAAIQRVMASGNAGAWPRITIRKLRASLARETAKLGKPEPDIARAYLQSRIMEIRVFSGQYAGVIAETVMPSGERFFDVRSLGWEDGKWLNAGQGHARSLDNARSSTCNGAANHLGLALRPTRPAIDNPDEYLAPFVDFLREQGEDPRASALRSLSEHKLTIMGEIHHRPMYWAFNSSLVENSAFADRAGVIYMELPMNDQDLVDRFLASDDLDTGPVVEMLRDMLWTGWPDQPMLDFFVTVWQVNRTRPPEQRLRIVLVDMARPWKDIQRRGDWGQYELVPRDQLMAENILHDLDEHEADARNALFIVGVGHTMLNCKRLDGLPIRSAGWHLREKLGSENVYAFFPHEPVMTNMGRVDGRLCMGLFDSAFAAAQVNRIAFPLNSGPFGAQPFDAMPDKPVWQSTYADGYDAYLYLGPLEGEQFSPLIEGFYTDEFVGELERRYTILYGRKWSKAYGRQASAKGFVEWMTAGSWGQPREKWQEKWLGPEDAWHRGGRDWKEALSAAKLEEAGSNPAIVTEAAHRLLEAIRTADYETVSRLNQGPDAWENFIDVPYCVSRDYPGWVRWVCRKFSANPIETFQTGPVFWDDTGRPTVSYELTLRDGEMLSGNLPFTYEAIERSWQGIQGLDWHLGKGVAKPR